jgi:DNA-directed RNA polymerase specialized sigma24 family protein
MTSQAKVSPEWFAASQGDEAGISAIIEKHQRLAFSAAAKVGSVSRRSDPADAAQAAMLYIVDCLRQGSFNGMTEDEFKDALANAARNKAKWFIRQQRLACRDVRRGEELFDDSAPTRDGKSEAVESVSELFAQFSDRKDCVAVLDGLLNGKTAPEMSKELGLTLDQVWRRVRYMRKHAVA